MAARKYTLKSILSEPSILLTILILLGFVLNVGYVDLRAVSTGNVGIGDSGKNIRAATVILSAILCFFYLGKTNGFKYVFEKSNAFLIAFVFLCISSTVFSPVKTLTLFKSFEIFTVVLILAIAYSEKNLYQRSVKYLHVLFWIYLITILGSYIQLAIYGVEGQRQLLGAQPLIGFMMTSRFPGLVGNALGFLGALSALFCLYKSSTVDKSSKKQAYIYFILFALSFVVVILSYTRSVLLFLLLAIFIYFFLRKKHAINMVMLVLFVISLATPQVQNKIVEHMKRGDTEENLATMSGRTEMWSAVFNRDPLTVIVGGGYATGSQFLNFEETGSLLKSANVHNGFLEVVMSVGLMGGAIWLAIMVRIFLQLYSFHKRVSRKISTGERDFHIFIICVFFLCYSRSLMNSTFAYLDYFYPVLIGMMIYGDSLKARANEIMNQGSKPAGEADKIEEPEVETRKYRGVTLR